MAPNKKTQKLIDDAVKKANQLAARRANSAAAKAKAAQTSAVRSTAARTRSNTLKGVEKNMGGVQRAGRAVDKGVAYAGAKLSAGRDALNRGVDKAKSAESRIMRGVGKYMTGTDLGTGKGKGSSPLWGKMSNKTLTNVGRGTVYGSAGVIGGSYLAGRASGNTGSSWSEKKKESGSSGWQRPTPLGF